MKDLLRVSRKLGRGTVGLLVLMNGMAFLGAVPAIASPDIQAPGVQGNEPTNATVNPRNPSQVAIMRGCRVLISNDFGQTFPVVRDSTIGPCNGDPVMAFDSQDRLFVTHLSRGFDGPGTLQVGVAQIADTTTTGSLSYTPVQVSTSDGNAHDKQWLVADANPVSPYRDNVYIVWTLIPPTADDPSQILFSRSTDQGQTWSAPQVISGNGEGFVWPSHLAVGPNGDLYIAYHTHTCDDVGLSGTVPLIRDGSGGANLAAGTIEQKTEAFGLGQASVACNEQNASGDEFPGTDFWLQGSVQPWVLPDPARPGNVYVVANDDPNDVYGGPPLAGDNADVVIARSLDNGRTFAVSRVDHGPGETFAVLPNAHIDQDGNIVVTWYDNRSGLRNDGTTGDGDLNFLLELYGTTSRDGGVTFVQDFKIADQPFDPDLNSPCRFGPNTDCGAVRNTERTLRIGEYNGIWTVNGIGYATWTGNATPPTVAGTPPTVTAQASGNQNTYFDLFSMLGAFPDPLEPNESRDSSVVANLGTDDRFNRSALTLHTATDVDFFKVTPLHTGYLEVAAHFNEVVADLVVQGIDRFGNVIGTGALDTLQPGSSTRGLALPVVKGVPYFVSVEVADAATSAPPQTTYDLSIVNRAAPEPFGLDLVTAFDSGRFDNDDVTNISMPNLRLRMDDADMLAAGVPFSPQNGTSSIADDEPGFKVAVERNGTLIGYAQPVAGQPGIYQFAVGADAPLVEGENLISGVTQIVDPSDDPSAAGTLHTVGDGTESAHALGIRLDLIAPATPDMPDLLASSDSGGVNIDNITTIMSPAFKGSVEPNALTRVLANGDVVGGAIASPAGAYEIVTEPLDDGVYEIGANAEDLAGNVSETSPPLQVTIANESLTLSAATADVVADVGAQTVTGYPGIPGGVVGIKGIPVIQLDAAGHGSSVLGTHEDDDLLFTPTGVAAGRLTRSGSSQVLSLQEVSGTLLLDPKAGSDEVTVRGTTDADTIEGIIADTATIQVNSWKAATIPTATAERIGIIGRRGDDTTDLTVLDSVSALLYVDSGDPGAIKPLADTLIVSAGSPSAKMKNAPGGSTEAEGSVFVTYPQTTGNATRIDYVRTERIKMFK